MTLGPHLLIANLDCECEFARIQLEKERGAAQGPLTLPRATLETISAFGTLLRCVSSHPSDVLWLPTAFDTDRVVDVPGLSRPQIYSEIWPPPANRPHVIAWGATPAIYELDERLEGSPDAAAHVNDREFCLGVARELGCALPHASVVRSVEELGAHLESAPATHGDEARWVVKSPFSAAGRSRVIGRGRSLESGDARRVTNLLAAQGRLIFEPWMQRTADFGCLVSVDRDGVTGFVNWHAQEIDAHGRFRGIRLVDSQAPFDLDEIERIANQVARRAADEGYSGRASIDFWTYLDLDGVERLHPLGEINARCSFGHIANLLRFWLERSTPWIASRGMCLRFGSLSQESENPDRIALLLPDENGRNAAWIEPAT